MSSSEPSSPSSQSPPNIPPASFSTLVQILASQSMAAMGMIAGPDGKVQKEPAIAKHFIDLLSVLEAKTKGNLDGPEAKMVDSLLHDLRMAYVQITK
jgi:hypothetical protein